MTLQSRATNAAGTESGRASRADQPHGNSTLWPKQDVFRLRSVPRIGYKEPLASQFSQRSEVICRRGTPRRAGAPARVTALSDWLVLLGLPRRCAGEPAVTNHKSVLQTGTTRSQEVSARIGVTSDEAENAPRLRVFCGEGSREPEPAVKRRVKTHTASA